jgi:hypothetical protein
MPGADNEGPFAFSPDKRLIAGNDLDGKVILWTRARKHRAPLPAIQAGPRRPRFRATANGSQAAERTK